MKNTIPLALLKAIEPIATTHLALIGFHKPSNAHYHFFDRENPDNFFIVYVDGRTVVSNYDASKYTVQWQPISSDHQRTGTKQLSSEEVSQYFQQWIDILIEYDETSSIYDDPILKTYADYYFDEYKIVDEDADHKPFNPKQQLHLEAYLEHLKVEAQKELEDKPELLAEIVQDVDHTITTMPEDTKRGTWRKITWLWAKLFKSAKPFAQKAVQTAVDTIIKEALNRLIPGSE